MDNLDSTINKTIDMDNAVLLKSILDGTLELDQAKFGEMIERDGPFNDDSDFNIKTISLMTNGLTNENLLITIKNHIKNDIIDERLLQYCVEQLSSNSKFCMEQSVLIMLSGGKIAKEKFYVELRKLSDEHKFKIISFLNFVK